ncbi:helix-turn-helix domain-containing protein [Caproiciproducens sp. LBM24188]
MQICNNNNASVVYTVDEIRNMLRIGKNQAYELVNSGKFHVLHIGKKILIPKIIFDNYLLGNDDHEQLQSKIVS